MENLAPNVSDLGTFSSNGRNLPGRSYADATRQNLFQTKGHRGDNSVGGEQFLRTLDHEQLERIREDFNDRIPLGLIQSITEYVNSFSVALAVTDIQGNLFPFPVEDLLSLLEHFQLWDAFSEIAFHPNPRILILRFISADHLKNFIKSHVFLGSKLLVYINLESRSTFSGVINTPSLRLTEMSLRRHLLNFASLEDYEQASRFSHGRYFKTNGIRFKIKLKDGIKLTDVPTIITEGVTPMYLIFRGIPPVCSLCMSRGHIARSCLGAKKRRKNPSSCGAALQNTKVMSGTQQDGLEEPMGNANKDNTFQNLNNGSDGDQINDIEASHFQAKRKINKLKDNETSDTQLVEEVEPMGKKLRHWEPKQMAEEQDVGSVGELDGQSGGEEDDNAQVDRIEEEHDVDSDCKIDGQNGKEEDDITEEGDSTEEEQDVDSDCELDGQNEKEVDVSKVEVDSTEKVYEKEDLSEVEVDSTGQVYDETRIVGSIEEEDGSFDGKKNESSAIKEILPNTCVNDRKEGNNGSDVNPKVEETREQCLARIKNVNLKAASYSKILGKHSHFLPGILGQTLSPSKTSR